MRKISILVLLVTAFVGYSLQAGVQALRLVAGEKGLWGLSEETWNLYDLADAYGVSSDLPFRAVDEVASGIDSCRAFFYEYVADGKRVICFKSDSGKYCWDGFCMGVARHRMEVGFLAIGYGDSEDSFWVYGINTQKKTKFLAGGFFEPYPVVASDDSFYVYQSSAKGTARIAFDSGEVSYPKAFSNSVVIAYNKIQDCFLVKRIGSLDREIVDRSGVSLGRVPLGRGDEALEFSEDGRKVYLSVFVLEKGRERRDFCVWDRVSGEVRVIRERFSVGLGQISRSD